MDEVTPNLLPEMAPDGRRNAIRVRFDLGSADHQVRQRIYEASTAAMDKLTQHKEITAMWTRLAIETLVRGLREEDALSGSLISSGTNSARTPETMLAGSTQR